VKKSDANMLMFNQAIIDNQTNYLKRISIGNTTPQKISNLTNSHTTKQKKPCLFLAQHLDPIAEKNHISVKYA
jgi:hypothetical protein